MGTLYGRLESDMREALKAKNQLRLSVLRMIISAARNVEMEKNVKTLEDADMLKILQKHLKQHKESIAQFEKGDRHDLVSKESAELVIIETYLPKQMTKDELTVIVKEAIAETNAVSKSDTGKVMKTAMAKVQGMADGKVVSAIVSELLK